MPLTSLTLNGTIKTTTPYAQHFYGTVLDRLHANRELATYPGAIDEHFLHNMYTVKRRAQA
ncbi:hypothetical protein KSZ_14450 [Dictyobacter formicarum]|uniref:Uncharacterized protein n=1 Tax=Dictyobacter formicarum TaxID=2778368 RepID=A0ABQ3VCF2_9CHLR|nr:hypothetical protein KSZ_14450 [Dictyobacter formicarum]